MSKGLEAIIQRLKKMGARDKNKDDRIKPVLLVDLKTGKISGGRLFRIESDGTKLAN